MGFLERTLSTRDKHRRSRSSKIEGVVLPGGPSQSQYPPKRKSIFPGLSSTQPEPSRPRASSARASYNTPALDGRAPPRHEQIHPPNTAHFASNHSFKCPSPALVNSKTKRTPPGSVAHLPKLPNDSMASFSTAPRTSTKPVPPSWNRAATDPVLSTLQHEALPKQAQTWEHPQGVPPRPQLQKQKSAWKSFGDLFRGKQPRQPNPEHFYQVQPPSNDDLSRSKNMTPSRVGVLESPLPSPSGNDEPTVARVDSGRDERLSPPNDKSVNSHLASTSPFPVRTSSRNLGNFGNPEPGTGNDAINNPRRTPRLDVNIPNAGFDRYSVMFEKLLEPKETLLERRLSKRENKKTSPTNAPETLHKSSGLQRSLTSPSLTRMPSLTIHIANSNYAVRSTQAKNTSKGSTAAQRPRPPKRSMTAPTTALSPPSVTARGTTPMTARAIPLPASTTNSSRCSILSENSLPPTPNTAFSLASSINTTIFGTTSTPKEAEAFTATQIATSSTTAKNNKTPAQPSQAPPPIPSKSEGRPQLIRNYPTGTGSFDRQIVQVSVARQVSVSKARRRVADAVEAKQPLRPRVVELGKNRKSTLVMIEGGDS